MIRKHNGISLWMDQIKEDEMSSAGSTNGAKRNAYRILERKSEGKRSLGKQGRRWMDNIKMDFRIIEWGGMDWIDLAHDKDHWRALLNMIINIWVPRNTGKFE
jgi:hypothetical protein